MELAVYTAGYEGRSVDAFLNGWRNWCRRNPLFSSAWKPILTSAIESYGDQQSLLIHDVAQIERTVGLTRDRSNVGAGQERTDLFWIAVTASVR